MQGGEQGYQAAVDPHAPANAHPTAQEVRMVYWGQYAPAVLVQGYFVRGRVAASDKLHVHVCNARVAFVRPPGLGGGTPL